MIQVGKKMYLLRARWDAFELFLAQALFPEMSHPSTRN